MSITHHADTLGELTADDLGRRICLVLKQSTYEGELTSVRHSRYPSSPPALMTSVNIVGDVAWSLSGLPCDTAVEFVEDADTDTTKPYPDRDGVEDVKEARP